MSDSQDYFNLAGTEDNTEEDDDATHPISGSSRAAGTGVPPPRRRRSGSGSSASSTPTIQQRRQLQQQQEQNSQRRLSQPLPTVDTARSAVPAPTSPRRTQVAYQESSSRPVNSRFRTQSSSNLPPGGLHRRRSRLRRATSVSVLSNPNLDSDRDDDEEGEDEEEEGEELEERRNKWNRVRATLPRRHTYHSDQVPDEYLEREEAEGANDYDGELTLKDRQDVMNNIHPFGLPLWKPALYKKSRSIVRNANSALHSSPPTRPELYLYPGNILWTLVFGWWLALVCLVVALLLYMTPLGGAQYGRVLRELAGYLLWPFGRYVERKVLIVNGEDGVEGEEDEEDAGEETALLTPRKGRKKKRKNWLTIQEVWGLGLGGWVFYFWLYLLIVPLQFLVTALCWFFVITIPMAKLNWVLSHHLRRDPLSLHFKSGGSTLIPSFTSTTHRASILLCTYQAIGLQYYKYTYDGINIIFINLLPLGFFVIADEYLLHKWWPNSPIAAPQTVFFLSLVSVIPLSYFIGMAVSSISAQSSMGVGAVINATFGSIIEIILYAVALMQGKAVLVEGSIIGSFLAGLLLMPGVSMVSGGVKRKEQRFNAKSAGVTSTMLIMALIGSLTPTLFYNIYGSFELKCEECPSNINPSNPYSTCSRCYYEQPNPATDKVYQNNVKPLMYLCAIVLPLAYLIGLWFSLHTHVKQIWEQGARPHESSAPRDTSAFRRLIPGQMLSQFLPGNYQTSQQTAAAEAVAAAVQQHQQYPFPPERQFSGVSTTQTPSSTQHQQLSSSPTPATASTVLLASLTPEELAQASTIAAAAAVTLAAASASPVVAQHTSQPSLGHSEGVNGTLEGNGAIVSPAVQPQTPAVAMEQEETADEEAAGHDSPNWSRTKSLVVLLACTVLYSLIAEILVETVDAVMENTSIDEKFLGLTLFALVPNITEFMNAISFALYGNIVLSLEIGSAYALQVALLQIPVMTAFSSWYNWNRVEEMRYTFSLIFPRWDIMSVLFSVFLLTYTYQEGKSNYFKGSILILSYLVLMAGFYYAPTVKTQSIFGF